MAQGDDMCRFMVIVCYSKTRPHWSDKGSEKHTYRFPLHTQSAAPPQSVPSLAGVDGQTQKLMPLF